MVFACQNDSFKQTFVSIVKSCQKISCDGGVAYEVICNDTILFPEGGGQPFDTGYLDDIPVYKVLRSGGDAVHYVRNEIPVGKEVKQTIDWERRLDHMQQHSGQHLITAIIENEYNIDTTAWNLGCDVSRVELDTKTLTDDQIKNIEKIANEKIREEAAVTVKVCEPGDPELAKGKTRGLPADVVGPIRLVEIDGMGDMNMCCGTHVHNTLQLQVIKLLYAEKGKKNKTNLFFLVGGRVLTYLSKALLREQKITKLLNNDVERHVELIEKLQINVKTLNKKLGSVLQRSAIDQAAAFLAQNPLPEFYIHHCKEAEQDYIQTFYRAVREDKRIESVVLVLLVGDGAGFVTIYGPNEAVSALGPIVANALDGKGLAQDNRFQAKVNKLKNTDHVQQLLKNYFTAKL